MLRSKRQILEKFVPSMSDGHQEYDLVDAHSEQAGTNAYGARAAVQQSINMTNVDKGI